MILGIFLTWLMVVVTPCLSMMRKYLVTVKVESLTIHAIVVTFMIG